MGKLEEMKKIEIKLLSYLEKDIIDKLRTSIEGILEPIGYTPKDRNLVFMGRVKGNESAKEKFSCKNLTSAEQMTDLVGVMLICFKEEDVKKIQDALIKEYTVLETSDYYKQPKESGYKSLHMDLETKDGVKFEIQIKDALSRAKQKYCHGNIYKNPDIPNEIKNDVNKIMNQVIEKYFKGKEIPLKDAIGFTEKRELDAIKDNCVAVVEKQHDGKKQEKGNNKSKELER